MKWISIEEMLPPNDVYVLIARYDGREKVCMHFIQIASRINDSWIDDKDGEVLNRKYGVVTHWMCLPDTPDKKV